MIVSAGQLIADGPCGELAEAGLGVPSLMGHRGGVRIGTEDYDVATGLGLEATEEGLGAVVMDALIGHEDVFGGAEWPAYAEDVGDFLDIYLIPSA